MSTLADAPDAFAASVARVAALERDPVLVRGRQQFAARHSWAERAERFAGLLGLPA